jgi:aryl-alcohol dehydrogenase-like predicted oxidoreductase
VHRRALYVDGPDVSEISYTTFGVAGGWDAVENDESIAALHAAIAAGVNFVDTAHVHGAGHSERVIGSVLRERSETVHIATKVPPLNRLWPAPRGVPVADAFPKGHIRAHTERSLDDLGVDSLDPQQLHVWSPDWLDGGDWQQEVADLRAEGLIRAFGVVVNNHDPGSAVGLVRSGLINTVASVYNIFDQSPEDELFAACREHGVGVIARMPLDNGGLTGFLRPDSTFPEADWRHAYFRGDRLAQVCARVDDIIDELAISAADLAETAIRYVLSTPEVATATVGMRRPAAVPLNAPTADGKGLPAAQVTVLKKHRWDRNFYI